MFLGSCFRVVERLKKYGSLIGLHMDVDLNGLFNYARLMVRMERQCGTQQLSAVVYAASIEVTRVEIIEYP